MFKTKSDEIAKKKAIRSKIRERLRQEAIITLTSKLSDKIDELVGRNTKNNELYFRQERYSCVVMLKQKPLPSGGSVDFILLPEFDIEVVAGSVIDISLVRKGRDSRELEFNWLDTNITRLRPSFSELELTEEERSALDEGKVLLGGFTYDMHLTDEDKKALQYRVRRYEEPDTVEIKTASKTFQIEVRQDLTDILIHHFNQVWRGNERRMPMSF